LKTHLLKVVSLNVFPEFARSKNMVYVAEEFATQCQAQYMYRAIGVSVKLFPQWLLRRGSSCVNIF